MTVTFLALAVLLQAPSGGEAPWPTFTSASGFSVAMPGIPVEQRETKASSAGPVENVTVTSKDGKSVYVAMRFINAKPITRAAEAQFFGELRTTTAKSAKVISEKAITLGGHPGRDLVLEIRGQGGETLVSLCRYLLMSPDVTFSLQVIRSTTDPAPRDRDVAAFFDSLKLVAPAKAGAAARGSKLAFRPFALPDAGFSMLMPGKPEESTTRQSTEKGSFTVRNFQCETALGLFAVSVLEYGPEVGNAPGATKAEMLARMCEALAADDKGQIVHQSSGLFEGFPAHRAIHVHAPRREDAAARRDPGHHGRPAGAPAVGAGAPGPFRPRQRRDVLQLVPPRPARGRTGPRPTRGTRPSGAPTRADRLEALQLGRRRIHDQHARRTDPEPRGKRPARRQGRRPVRRRARPGPLRGPVSGHDPHRARRRGPPRS